MLFRLCPSCQLFVLTFAPSLSLSFTHAHSLLFLQFSWMNTTEITRRYFHKFVMKNNSSRNCYTNGILRKHVLHARIACVCVWTGYGNIAQRFFFRSVFFFFSSIHRRHVCVCVLAEEFQRSFQCTYLCAWSIQFSTFTFCWLHVLHACSGTIIRVVAAMNLSRLPKNQLRQALRLLHLNHRVSAPTLHVSVDDGITIAWHSHSVAILLPFSLDPFVLSLLSFPWLQYLSPLVFPRLQKFSYMTYNGCY